MTRTCKVCTYEELDGAQFPCRECLNMGKLVEDAVPSNYPPKVEKKCSNCKHRDLAIGEQPCYDCVWAIGDRIHWTPRVEEPLHQDVVDSFMFGVNDFITSGVLNGVKITWASPVTSPLTTNEVSVSSVFSCTDPIKPFWIVCADGNSLEAHVRHDTEKSAVDEAHRLAKKTGKTFQVFKSVAKVVGHTTSTQENYGNE